MKYRLLILVLVAVIFAVCTPLAFAQVAAPQPDAGVRGSGAILTTDSALGAFDINVAKFGTTLSGGIRYTEITPDGRRGAVIYSQSIDDLGIDRGSAIIKATGYWNGIASKLTVEVLDAAAGDRFRIIAEPISTPTGPTFLPYDQGGPLTRGDIVVFNASQTPDAYAKGYGTIDLSPVLGRFEFGAAKSGDNVKGSIGYMELNPIAASPIARPRIAIYCPSVQTLTVTGNTAVLTGKGTLNGRPASIKVDVTDNSVLASPAPVADYFHIIATPLNASSAMPAYEASGYLKTGEISVGSK